MTQDSIEQSVLSRAALVIKRVYCMLRARAQKLEVFSPPDDKYGKFWTNAAITCIKKRINPAEYTEIQFRYNLPYPEIQQITSEAALKRYYDHSKDYAASYAADFDMQLQVYTRRIRELDMTPEDILRDPSQRFDPLFMYSVGVHNNLPEIVRETEEAALLQYLTSVHYDQLYRDIVPEEFKEKGRNLWEGIDANR